MSKSNLPSRIEGEEVGSRELDVAICCALHDGPDWAKEEYIPLKGGVGLYSNGEGGPGLTAPCYTTSLDAALALVERVLPGEWVEITGPRKYLHIPSPSPNRWRAACGSVGWGATPALALCAALLKALPKNEGERG